MSTDRNTVAAYNNHAYLWAGKMRSGKNNAHLYLEKPAMITKLPDLTGKTVLCLGCGSGEEVEIILAKNPKKIVGIDISEKLIEIAKSTYPDIEFYTMDMEQLHFDSEVFDYVYSSLTLHYVEDWSKTLHEVYRVMKPGGLFLFSTHHPLKWGAEQVKRDGKHLHIIGIEKGDSKSDYTLYGDYLAITQGEAEWFDKLKIKFYNRPLSGMFTSLKESGFDIRDMLEPKPIEAVKDIDKRFWEIYNKIPLFIIWEVSKPE